MRARTRRHAIAHHHTFSLISFQIMRVISSPSNSTTGWATVIRSAYATVLASCIFRSHAIMQVQARFGCWTGATLAAMRGEVLHTVSSGHHLDRNGGYSVLHTPDTTVWFPGQGQVSPKITGLRCHQAVWLASFGGYAYLWLWRRRAGALQSISFAALGEGRQCYAVRNCKRETCLLRGKPGGTREAETPMKAQQRLCPPRWRWSAAQVNAGVGSGVHTISRAHAASTLGRSSGTAVGRGLVAVGRCVCPRQNVHSLCTSSLHSAWRTTNPWRHQGSTNKRLPLRQANNNRVGGPTPTAQWPHADSNQCSRTVQ